MKMQNFKTAIIFLLLANILLLAFFIFKRPAKREEPKYIIIKELQLNPKQVEAYEVLIKKHQGEMRKEREQVFDLKQRLYQSLVNEILPEEREKIIAEIGEHQKNIEHFNFSHFQEIEALCTPEQKERFNKLAEKLADLFVPPPKKP